MKASESTEMKQAMTARNLIDGIAHVGLRVHDLSRARVFYEQLGFEFVVGPIGPEPVAIMTHPSGIELNLILNAARDSVPNVLMDIDEKHAGYTHTALAVRDVTAMQAVLEANGIQISGGPITFPNGTVSIFVRDPDRNVVEFNQST